MEIVRYSLEAFRGEVISADRFPHPEIAGIFSADIIAALRSARIVRRMFYGIPLERLKIEYKPDETPKTIADTEGDVAILQTIRRVRPNDDLILEESGYHKALARLHPTNSSKVRHYADSLDGSRPFVEKKPWSTVGVGAVESEGNYLTGVIVHPFRQELAVAVRGLGSHIVSLDTKLHWNGKPRDLHVNNKTFLAGATVCIDSLFTAANAARKHQFMTELETAATSQGKVLSYDMTGSNIAYQLDIACGKSLLGFTDCIGGPWDWRIGQPLVKEAGGIMLDAVTGKEPTDVSAAVLYGNSSLVMQVLPIAQRVYAGYTGF